jgi:hypothetical protein
MSEWIDVQVLLPTGYIAHWMGTVRVLSELVIVIDAMGRLAITHGVFDLRKDIQEVFIRRQYNCCTPTDITILEERPLERIDSYVFAGWAIDPVLHPNFTPIAWMAVPECPFLQKEVNNAR